MSMRVEEHPILGRAAHARRIWIKVDGRPVEAYEGEPVAMALQAAGIRILHRTQRTGEARGTFCAIGRCTDCVMEVDGRSNVRTCVTPAREGMEVRTQIGSGRWGGHREG